jgi:prepilin-type N-terminal cleavage/methylation domain-containing protein
LTAPAATKIATMNIRTYRNGGFTLIEIMIVAGIIALLAALAAPNFLGSRRASQTNVCINNLRQIDAAKTQWALENGKGNLDIPTGDDVKPYLGRGSSGSMGSVYCPLSGQGNLNGYAVNAVGTVPQCNNYNATAHPGLID